MKHLKQPQIQGIIDVQAKPTEFQAVQLTWHNWGFVCQLVPFNRFAGGVWVDPNDRSTYSYNPLPEISVADQHIGLLIKSPKPEDPFHQELISQGMWILYDKESDTFATATEEKFAEMFRILPVALDGTRWQQRVDEVQQRMKNQ
jgi:hypothetical protein